jgi:hypothetical protein
MHFNTYSQGKIQVGSRALPWELYRDLNMEMFKLGTGEAITGVAFAKATVNLACRGDSTGQICTKHLAWGGDSFGIPFTHEKRNQQGEDPLKKLPRQCYCNPLDFASDLASSLFHYMCSNPDVIANRDGSLFPGSRDAQGTAFSRIWKKVCIGWVDEDGLPLCTTKHSVPLEDISLYSLRKCAHTQLNCGSTAGPSGAAACLREGHSIGTVRNRYIAQERASDEFCGRILAGLPVNSEEFAVSYPDFIPIDIEESIRSHVSDRVYQNKKKEVDRKVRLVLDSIFGYENMRNFPAIHQFLRIGLASHLHHLDKIEELLPPNANLRGTALFTNPLVSELKQHVRIAMPWDGHYIYFADSSGLPPHVMELAKLRSIEEKVDKVPDVTAAKIETLFESHQMNGPVSLTQMKKLVENSPTMKMMAAAVSRLEVLAQERAPTTEPREVENFTGGIGTRYDLFNHPGGIQRRIPPDWKIPMLSIQHMYLQWHCGNEAKKISPIKNFDQRDLSCLGTRAKKSFSELKRMMGAIDKAATESGVPPKKGYMTQAEAASCFLHGQHGLNIPATTPTGKPRNIARLTWSSAVKYMPTAKGRKSK